MSRRHWAIVLILFLAPAAFRTLWFHQGSFARSEPVPLPDYSSLRLATPPFGPAVLPIGASHPADRIVLLDWAHQNQFEVTELEVLAAALNAQGARFEVVSPSFDFSALPLEERLKYAEAYLVAAPNLQFTQGEVQAVAAFVDRGGHLLIISDPTRGSTGFDPFGFYLGPTFGDVAAANELLAPHDLAFSNDYLYNLRRNEGNFRNVFLAGSHAPLGVGLEEVALYGARSVTTLSGTPDLVGDAFTYSSRTDRGGAHAAAGLSPDQNVVALGDLTFLMPPYHEVADNARLIGNLADFLLGGSRLRDLEDFPYLFTHDVEILESEVFRLTADHLRSLAAAQTGLGSLGHEVRLAAKRSDGADAIIFGTFEESESTRPFLRQMDVVLPSGSNDGRVTLPGFPPFDPTGVGVLLVVHDDRGTTLLLLAETEVELQSTFDLVTNRDLSQCFLRRTAAICQVGAADFAGFNFTENDFIDFGPESALPTPIP